MDKEKAERAKSILEDLELLNKALDATDEERGSWWSLLPPDVKSWYHGGEMQFPDSFCRAFVEAAKKTIKQLEDELKAL